MLPLLDRASSDSDLIAIRRKHENLISQLTLDGLCQLQTAAYGFALHDCRNNANALACAYADEAKRRIGIASEAARNTRTARAHPISTPSESPILDSPVRQTTNQSAIPDEMLVHLGLGATYLRENVRGMSQREKDLLMRLAEISHQISDETSDVSSEDLWVEAAQLYAQLTAGGRRLLNEGMERDTGITADTMFRVRLQEYGYSMPASSGAVGCPCAAFIYMFLTLGILVMAAFGILLLF